MTAAFTLAVALGLGIVFGVQTAGAVNFHGIAVTKGCDTPVKVGHAYTCSYQILNVVDTAHDTLTVTSLVDTVHRAGGDLSSANLLDLTGATLTLSGGASCDGTKCTLPFGATITTPSLSYYNVQPADYNLPGHVLTDDVVLTWQDLCTSGSPECPIGDKTASTGSQATVQQLTSQTATTIHNAAHGPVTVVETGATVHDFVSVTGESGEPNPSGNVSIDWFTNNQCTGGPAASSGPIAINGSGQVDATGFAQGPLAAGFYGFKATYAGDGTYAGSVGPCEPLQVVDANIQLTPATATNAVNTNHTLHCHINVNDGSGQVNAPDGTICTVTIISGPGTPVSQNCTIGNPTPGSGSCDVTITSSTTGTSVIRASTDVSVAGLVLHRQTGDAHAGDSADAQKVWVNANIQITPATATNPIGTNHVLTITVNAIGGTIDAGGGTATASILSGPGTFVGSPSCTYTGGGASASCTVTITSNVAGTTVVQATSNIPVNGQSITRTTGTADNTAAGGSGNAQKIWLAPDANIQLTPATATNPVGTNHTLHCHINVSTDSVTYTNAPDGTVCTVTITSGPGTPVSQNCTTTGGTGTCDVQITSATSGTTTLNATTTVVVNGITLTRTTNGTAGNSGPATKLWADDTVSTTVRDANGNDVTGQQVPPGTVVHDEATVAKDAGTPASVPNPTGSVSFTLYDNGTCNGNVLATDANKPLNGSGVATSATFTVPAAGGSFSYRAHYNGDVNYPAHDAGCEPFSSQPPPPPGGQITPTQVDCSSFASGTAPTLSQINYPKSNGLIGQGIDPGVFFYWARITTTVPNQVVVVSQSNTSTNNAALFSVAQGWDRVYTSDCSSWRAGVVIGTHDSGARFVVPTPGNYIIGVKYSTKSIAGTPVPVPSTITYNFVSNLGPSTAASVLLVPK